MPRRWTTASERLGQKRSGASWSRPGGWRPGSALRAGATNFVVLQWSNRRKSGEVAITVHHGQLMPHGARRKQAVDARSHGDATPTRTPIQVDGVIDDRGGQRRLDTGQR